MPSRRDFESAVRREAVQENSIRRGLREKSLVDLKFSESVPALPVFCLLAHAGPDVRVDGLCSSNSFFGRAQDLNSPVGFTRHALSFGNDFGVGFVTRRRGDAHMRPAASPDA